MCVDWKEPTVFQAKSVKEDSQLDIMANVLIYNIKVSIIVQAKKWDHIAQIETNVSLSDFSYL